jgi:hypothetical protein
MTQPGYFPGGFVLPTDPTDTRPTALPSAPAAAPLLKPETVHTPPAPEEEAMADAGWDSAPSWLQPRRPPHRRPRNIGSIWE